MRRPAHVSLRFPIDGRLHQAGTLIHQPGAVPQRARSQGADISKSPHSAYTSQMLRWLSLAIDPVLHKFVPKANLYGLITKVYGE